MTARRHGDSALLGALLFLLPACAHERVATSSASRPAAVSAAAPTRSTKARLASPQAVPPGSAKVESTKPPPGTETTPPDPPARAVAEPTRAPEPPPAAAEPAPAAAEPAPARPHAAAEPALKPGAAVMIEQRLEIAGALLAQQATGELGPATRAALARFQAGNGLPPTGEVDEATVRKLDLDPRNILFETEPGALK